MQDKVQYIEMGRTMYKGPPLERGTVVYLRYLDLVLFKDVDPSNCRLFVREAVGWLDHEDSDFIRIVWERFAEPAPGGKAKQRATGLVILKESILELRRG